MSSYNTIIQEKDGVAFVETYYDLQVGGGARHSVCVFDHDGRRVARYVNEVDLEIINLYVLDGLSTLGNVNRILDTIGVPPEDRSRVGILSRTDLREGAFTFIDELHWIPGTCTWDSIQVRKVVWSDLCAKVHPRMTQDIIMVDDSAECIGTGSEEVA